MTMEPTLDSLAAEQPTLALARFDYAGLNVETSSGKSGKA